MNNQYNMLIKTAFLFLFSTALYVTSIAQCNKLHLKCNKGTNPLYKISEQSQSFNFKNEQSHDFELDLKDGIVYRITICGLDENLNESIPFEIYTEKAIMQYDERKEKLVEIKKPMLMYTNRDDSLSASIEFQSVGSKEGFVRVFYPEIKFANSNMQNCIGVLIQYQKEVGQEDE